MFHRVGSGDTLSQIAEAYDTRVSTLVALNNLNSRHRIRAGQNLRLPAAGPAPVRPAVTEPVAFHRSSAEIRTSSFATLDRIIEIANDCRDNSIAIIGHSDALGDESWNRRLSRARAQAVADYVIRAGIQQQRVVVEGLGSSQPIADNSTAHGRGLNRRIEFELRQSSL